MNPVDEENVGSPFIQVMFFISLHRNAIHFFEKVQRMENAKRQITLILKIARKNEFPKNENCI